MTSQNLSISPGKSRSALSPHQIDGFTETVHSDVPAYMLPDNVNLPPNFTACVIGASRGIGEEIAYSYVKAGAHNVIVAARDQTRLDAVVMKIRGINSSCDSFAVRCDVGFAESVEELSKTIKSKVGRLDAVILNSGYSGDVILDITKTPVDSFRTATDVNFLGTFYVAHHLIPLLMETTNGAKHFLVVGSVGAAIVSGPIANAQYCATKAAQMKLVEHTHEQFAAKGLLALCIHPGAVATEMALKSKGAEHFVREFCKDSPALCGAWLVWLTQDSDRKRWLGGRLVNAQWDVMEMEKRRDEVVEKDLLKFIIDA